MVRVMLLHTVSVVIRGEIVDRAFFCSVDEALGFAKVLRRHDVRCKTGVAEGVSSDCSCHAHSGVALMELTDLFIMTWQGVR